MTTTFNNEWVLKVGDIYEDVTSIPPDCYGFVYRITNVTNDKKYIGKKLFYSQKTKQVKGKKKRYKVESNWKEYFGSNEELLSDVQLLGKNKFFREILKFCQTKGDCSYYEAKYQFEYDVLLNPEMYYNSWVMCKIHRKHLKFTEAG
jgi:hypothetical protein